MTRPSRHTLVCDKCGGREASLDFAWQGGWDGGVNLLLPVAAARADHWQGYITGLGVRSFPHLGTRVGLYSTMTIVQSCVDPRANVARASPSPPQSLMCSNSSFGSTPGAHDALSSYSPTWPDQVFSGINHRYNANWVRELQKTPHSFRALFPILDARLERLCAELEHRSGLANAVARR